MTAQRPGMIVPVVLITSVFILMIAGSVLSLSLNNLKLARVDTYRLNAQVTADAGIDAAVVELNEDAEWAGTAGEVELYSGSDHRVTYEAEVADTADPDEKLVTVTGRTYAPASSSTAKSERRYEVLVEGLSTNAGSFSLVTGVGGLLMSNNAKIVAGDVFVNGEIEMNNSASIGLAGAPVTVKSAHQLCPTGGGTTYPQVCAAGNGEPIDINDSAHIYGEVRATNQTTGAGMSDPGLIANQTVTPLEMPDYDRDAQKAAVAVTRTGSDASCSGNGSKTWAANTKITGNVTLSNNCQVTINGNVWITGNLTASNSARINVGAGLSDAPVIMIDGSTGLRLSNGSKIVTNASGTGAQVITYYSRASCSPDCADVTGNDLYDSRDETTIEFSNSAEGPETVFYARWSRIRMSNGGAVGALVAQTIELSNSATVTFGTEVPTEGSAEQTWIIRNYKRIY